jgi:16S rRNA (cytosine967-C5)-methyltransferase
MKSDPVRRLALTILVEVEAGKILDRQLDAAFDQLSEPRDRAFLAEMVRGTIQWRERYRHILKSFAKRQLPEDPVLLQLLFLSTHQLLAMGSVPPYAAIHQAGQLCRERVSDDKVGFVNGLLQALKRRLLPEEGNQADAARLPDPSRLLPLFDDLSTDPVRHLAAWQSHPMWLIQRWVDRFGAEATEAICNANNQPLDLGLRVLEPQSVAEACALLQEAGCPAIRVEESRSLVVPGRLARPQLRELLERFPWLIVQDETVQRATSWLMSGRDDLQQAGHWPGEDLPVLDMCASPGGKTVRLAAGWADMGPLLAMDGRPERLARLRDTVQRTGHHEVQILLGDGTCPPLEPGSCAAVLVDGPCSGTGVIRHHPEARWRLERRSPKRNGKVLEQLALKAAELLAPGGLLMYATCSLEIEENEKVIASVLAQVEDLEPCPDSSGRWQRLWLPGQDGGGDGFFAARLSRKVRQGVSL